MAADDVKAADCKLDSSSLHPDNPIVTPMLTDLYQITMAYAYWKHGRQDEPSVFDLFFRKNPFQGEFTIFGGLSEAIKFIASFKFQPDDIAALRKQFPHWEEEFLSYLANLDTKSVKVYAVREGTLVFPRIPLMRIEGPLGICQLLETTLLVLCNFASLVCTNAARHRLAAGPHKSLFEFGLRRAQGPDGAMTASKYSYIGGFDGTSNVAAAMKYGIAVKGTHAHSFVSSFISIDELSGKTQLVDSQGQLREFAAVARKYRDEINNSTNLGELAAFISYAMAYPNGFMALVDTYDTLNSGVLNFLSVALALNDFGFKAIGIRLDSGDLAYLSKQARKTFREIAARYSVNFDHFQIIASNDLNESVLYSLKEQGHEIDGFGIGTNLVTCQAQPALGGVYKLVEVKGQPRIKVSQDPGKVTIPGRKEAYRLFDSTNKPVLDLMVEAGTQVPEVGRKILCRHPFDEKKRCYVIASRVEPLHVLIWADGELKTPLPPLAEIRARAQEQLDNIREDHLRRLNPTPYKVSVTSDLYTFMHDLWMAEAPVPEYS